MSLSFRYKAEQGIALTELAILIVPLVFVIVAGIEITSYMRQRQVAQMLSREAAVIAYKNCSGYEDPVPGSGDPDKARRCLEKVEQDLRNIRGDAGTATFLIGIYRCDPPAPGVACITPRETVRHYSPGPTGVTIDPTEFSTRATSDPAFRNLLISQRAAIAVRITFPFRFSLGNVWGWTMRAFNNGEVTDVTIL